ncbi:MAG: cobalt-precorrin-5B (C(1))-methyltransferase CbiD, partial [Sporomusaceae bacterium]|nr:cobalt-precorrin-5B (C(1))-methyltransferase CbiD [Sporomusaceae bacterium]
MKKLRTGVTTGACAAAAAKAAAIALFSGQVVSEIAITAKSGAELKFAVTDAKAANNWAQCAVQKDAGDDPDITNGLKIFASLAKTNTAGIEVDGGSGVGRVTKPGLKVPVGQAAINPVPLEMIKTAVQEVCAQFSHPGGVKVVISVPEGAATAKKTMNERLGIVGGISILGTTGIVEPMSLKAIVETIKTEIDVQLAAGKKELLITPGNYGRDFAADALGLDIAAAIKCANFIGETLDYACESGVKKITLIGHAG